MGTFDGRDDTAAAAAPVAPVQPHVTFCIITGGDDGCVIMRLWMHGIDPANYQEHCDTAFADIRQQYEAANLAHCLPREIRTTPTIGLDCSTCYMFDDRAGAEQFYAVMLPAVALPLPLQLPLPVE